MGKVQIERVGEEGVRGKKMHTCAGCAVRKENIMTRLWERRGGGRRKLNCRTRLGEGIKKEGKEDY